MTLRRAAAAVLACIALGGALALADQGNPPAGAPSPVWTTRPEVPGSASTLVPFGMETTADGPRAWALGRAGDGTVVLRRGAGGAWAPVGAALGGLAPVGGDAPQHAAEMSADGHGALLVVARGDAHAEAALYTRAPGGDFAAALAPGVALLAGEHLAGDATSTAARTLLAASSGDDTTTSGAFVVPTAADGTAVAVLHFGTDGWTREAVHPPGTDALHPLGLAVVSPGQAWLLARAGDTTGGASDRLVLLRRVEGAVVSWEATAILPDALLGGAALAAGLDAVTVAPAPADPLTAVQDGLWIDLRLKIGDHVVDATEHLRVSAPAGPDPSSSAPSTSTPSSSAPSSSTPSSATPSTTTPAGSAAAPTVQVDGRWCDARTPAGDAICDHPLGLALDGDRGYRSLAFPGTGDRPFGRRFISAPLDAGVAAAAPRRRAERQGGFAALSGERFVLADGIGDDGSATSTTQAIAFDADGNGLIGGARALGATSLTAPAANPPAPEPGFREPIVDAERAPGGDGAVLALSPFGMQQLYQPGQGWTLPSTLMFPPATRNRPYAPVRTIAWARPDLLIGAGSAGVLITLHEAPRPAENGNFDGQRASPGPDLPVSATFLDVACTAGGRLECVAVGLDGLLLRGDGDTWTTERLPGAGAHADITSIRYAGRTALLATSAGLFTGEEGDWHADPTITEPIRVLAALPDGGAAIDGKWERDDAAAPWHRVRAPLDWHPIAIAAYRTAGHVRTLVAATADVVPLPAALPDDQRSRPGSTMLMTDPPPDGAVLFRETDDGWVDLDHASYQRSGGRDLPASTPNTRALAVDDTGSGWAFGGPAGVQTEESPSAISQAVTAGWIQQGAPAAFPDTTATAAQTADVPETPVPDGSVRLAIGGHPACLDRCAAAGGQGVAADVHLQGLVARVAALRAGGGGPAALIVGGGRASVGGEPLDLPGARRYRALLQDAGLPTYVLPGPGDLPGGGADAFGAAFATWPAPEGPTRRHRASTSPRPASRRRRTRAAHARRSRSTCARRRAPCGSSPSTTPPAPWRAAPPVRRAAGSATCSIAPRTRGSQWSSSAACRSTPPPVPRRRLTPLTRSRCSPGAPRPMWPPPGTTTPTTRSSAAPWPAARSRPPTEHR